MIDDDASFDERPTPPIDDSDEIRVQRRSGSHPAIIALDAHPSTDPLAHYTRPPDDADRATIDVVGVDPDSPVPRVLLYRERNSRLRHEGAQDQAIRELADRQLLIDDLNKRLGEAENLLTGARKWWSRGIKLFWSALGALLLAGGAVAGAIWNRSAQETEAHFKLEQVGRDLGEEKSAREKESQQCRDAIDKLRDLLYRHPTSQNQGIRADESALALKGKTP